MSPRSSTLVHNSRIASRWFEGVCRGELIRNAVLVSDRLARRPCWCNMLPTPHLQRLAPPTHQTQTRHRPPCFTFGPCKTPLAIVSRGEL